MRFVRFLALFQGRRRSLPPRRLTICSHVSALYYSLLALRHWDVNRNAKFPPECPRHAFSHGTDAGTLAACPHWAYSYEQMVLKSFARIIAGEKKSSTNKILWTKERGNVRALSDPLQSMLVGISLKAIRDSKVQTQEAKAAAKPPKKRGRSPKAAAPKEIKPNVKPPAKKPRREADGEWQA